MNPYMIIIVVVWLICFATVSGNAQYFSISQQEKMFTAKRKGNPKVNAKKEKMRLARRDNKARRNETFLVTGAGNPDLAKKKLGLTKSAPRTGLNYNRTRRKKDYQNGPGHVKSVYQLNKYKND